MDRRSDEPEAGAERRRLDELGRGDRALSSTDEKPDDGHDPLAGVLDRLMSRERWDRGVTPIRPGPRMIVVAGMGRDGGLAALRAAAQWAVLLARRVVLSDCFDSAEEGADGRPPPGSDLSLSRVRVCCTAERLALMRADVVVAVLEQLKRHERSADLLLVRAPLRERIGLMRAAFLGRALVVPLDETTVGDAVALSRDLLQSLPELALWPWSETPRLLRRYTEALRSELPGARALPFDPARLDLAPVLDGLPGPPEEGFLGALVLPTAAGVPPELLRFDSLPLA